MGVGKDTGIVLRKNFPVSKQWEKHHGAHLRPRVYD